MALGNGGWFRGWRDTSVIGCALVSATLLGAVQRASRKRTRQDLNFAAPVSEHKLVPAAEMSVESLRALLPVMSSGGVQGVKAVQVARLFGVMHAEKAVLRAKLLSADSKVLKGSVGRLLLNPVGAGELLLHMPKGSEIRKVKKAGAQILAREKLAPMRRRGVSGVVPFLLELARSTEPAVVFRMPQ